MARRTNQTDRTRSAIVEAASDMMFGAVGPDEFTMQNVADAAGVSHRTLYRYFDSRKALVNAVGAEYDKRLESSVPIEAFMSFDRWVENVGNVMAFGAAHANVLRRAVALALTTGDWRTDRDEKYWRLFRERFPSLDESVARQDFAVLRHLLWSSNAILIGQRFELTSEEVAVGVTRGIEAMIGDIEERNTSAANTKGRP